MCAFVRQWHTAALNFIDTKAFEDTWVDFLYVWPRVKFAGSGDAVPAALKSALSKPFPAKASLYDSLLTKQLVALCCQLQRVAEDGFFYLSCRKAADLLNTDRTTVNRAMRAMLADGVLIHVTDWQQNHESTVRKGFRYRYVD
jgi:hypothetical protein